ncbi:universal stress protein [Fundidesulfovibrio butyratiphilus]
MLSDPITTERHLLVTVSDDGRALTGLRFVHDFFQHKDNLRLTLFSVEPGRCDDASLPDPVVRSHGRAPAFAPNGGRSKVLLEAGKWLEDMGFPPDRVELKSHPSKLGPVKDIAEEAEKGFYDAVVLGRRGLTWFNELFADSVTHRLLWEAVSFPLWVCRNPARRRSGVLLCVDGSEPSLRVADHVGFILRGQPEHTVTVFQCMSGARGERADVEDSLSRAGETLLENGVEAERIAYLAKTCSSPADAILNEAKHGAYAAVAIGRSSGRPSALTNIFGSTSLNLLRNLEGSALWLSK